MRRVLVVDDDPDIRLLLEELLRGAGYEVETAEDGRAALRTFHASPTDLIVLDLSMPDLDGFETLDRIRDLSDVPVILSTRNGSGPITVEVTDTGIGIPEDEVAQVFSRFYRASSATRRAIPGTGLGLVIARAIVEGHGGTISLESSEGEGTRVTVTLPRQAGGT